MRTSARVTVDPNVVESQLFPRVTVPVPPPLPELPPIRPPIMTVSVPPATLNVPWPIFVKSSMPTADPAVEDEVPILRLERFVALKFRFDAPVIVPVPTPA